jgi:hypothetical protein
MCAMLEFLFDCSRFPESTKVTQLVSEAVNSCKHLVATYHETQQDFTGTEICTISFIRIFNIDITATQTSETGGKLQ